MIPFQKIHEWLLLRKIKRVLAIEIIELRNTDSTSVLLNALLIQRNKTTINIIDKIRLSNIIQLQNWIEKNNYNNQPILLLINGDKILHRLIDEQAHSNKELLLKELIPNGSLNDFYLQEYKFDSGQAFISIARINYIDGILSQLNSIENNIINISIGPLPLFLTYKLILKQNTQQLYQADINNYHFAFTENGIAEYSISDYTNEIYNQSYLNFVNEEISSDHLLAYSSGISFLLSPLSEVNIPHTNAITNKNELYFNILSKNIIAGSLAVLFIILLVSSIFYSLYSNKFDNTEQLLSSYQTQLLIHRTELEIRNKENEVLQNYGLVNKGNIAYYADQITKTLPNGIYLNKLEIFPPKSNTEDAAEIIETNRIIINGNCFSSSDIVDWSNQLKEYQWIDKLTINHYKQEDINKLGSFCIEIIKKDLQ